MALGNVKKKPLSVRDAYKNIYRWNMFGVCIKMPSPTLQSGVA